MPPQDIKLYAEVARKAAANASARNQPGSPEFRAKQAFDFYMAVINPPDMMLLMRGTARYVVLHETEPFLKAVQPLFEVGSTWSACSQSPKY